MTKKVQQPPTRRVEGPTTARFGRRLNHTSRPLRSLSHPPELGTDRKGVHGATVLGSGRRWPNSLGDHPLRLERSSIFRVGGTTRTPTPTRPFIGWCVLSPQRPNLRRLPRRKCLKGGCPLRLALVFTVLPTRPVPSRRPSPLPHDRLRVPFVFTWYGCIYLIRARRSVQTWSYYIR